jgi:hypothetical protein
VTVVVLVSSQDDASCEDSTIGSSRATFSKAVADGFVLSVLFGAGAFDGAWN